ncbi:O-acetylhomoserine aminocarboxypropyltransferase/cysteine synthase family protein [Bifidobacterium sp.]|uniref:O-acetylhomoserine aminocarboxypropyltransferase/cysteine synthase family protein n=1 Tax=Bifidobacterium sp. TaxID=41200 RepID=UPI0039EBD4E2
MNRKNSFDTVRIQGGYTPEEHNHASNVPIYLSAAFTMGSAQRGRDMAEGREPGFTYSRVGNPTVDILERRIAALDGGVSAVAVSSGMAAISNTILAVAEGGGRIVAHHDIYGASLDEFVSLAPKLGIEFDFVDDINNPDEVGKAIGPNTKAIYAESVTNPITRVTDVDRLASVAHQAGIPLIVDNTFPTPYLFRPIEHGADIVVYSSTKGINGHGNVVSGLIVDAGRFDWSSDRFPQFSEPEFTLYTESNGRSRSFVEAFGNEAFHQRLRCKFVRLLGAVLGPQEAYLELLGLETISERISKEVSSALRIANFLNHHEHVTKVNYAGLPDSKQSQLVSSLFPKGIGAILSFELEGSEDRVDRFIDATDVFHYVPNVGDVRSLIVNPARITHREVPFEFWERNGLNVNLIRLSIGLEDADDLIADLEQAFETAYRD